MPPEGRHAAWFCSQMSSQCLAFLVIPPRWGGVTLLYFARLSRLPAIIPVQKAPRGKGSFTFPRSLFRVLVSSFASSFIHSLVHSFHSSPLQPGFEPARATPRVSGLTLPPGLSPAPFPPCLLSGPIGTRGPGGAGGGAGPRFPTTPGCARGSGNAPRGCWAHPDAVRSVALPATPGLPGPCQRRFAEGRASAAAWPG